VPTTGERLGGVETEKEWHGLQFGMRGCSLEAAPSATPGLSHAVSGMHQKGRLWVCPCHKLEDAVDAKHQGSQFQ